MFIEIRHPDLPNSECKVDERAFVNVWGPKGWVRVEDTPKPVKKKTKETAVTPTVESTDEPDDTLP